MKGNLFSNEERKSLKTTYEISPERIKEVEGDGRFSKQDLEFLRSTEPCKDVHDFHKVFFSLISATAEDNQDTSQRLEAEKMLKGMAESIKNNLRSLDFDRYVATKQYTITGIKSTDNSIANLITRIYLGAKTFGFTEDSHLDRRIDDHCSSSGYYVSGHLKPMKVEVNPSAQETNVTENICRFILRFLAFVAIIIIAPVAIIGIPLAALNTIPDDKKNAVLKNKTEMRSGGDNDLRPGLGNSNDLSEVNIPKNLKPYEIEKFQFYKTLGKSRTSTELSKFSRSIGASGSKAAGRGAKIEKTSAQSLRDEGTPKPGSNPING